MDSRESKDSGDSGSKPDTSHLNSHVVSGKKSSSKLLVSLVVLVVVVAAGAAGYFFYKTNVLDKDSGEAAVTTSPSKSPAPKTLKPEEQMTASLDDGIAKEMDELKKGDDTSAIKNSTLAASSVGIGEANMKELERLSNEEKN